MEAALTDDWTDLGPVLLAIGGLLASLTLLSTLRSPRWWIRMADFPRLQLALVLTVILALVLWQSDEAADRVFAAVLALCLIYQTIRVWPYTPLARRQVKDALEGTDAPRIRLLIANVLMENRNSGALVSLVHQYDPDIVLLVETDRWWSERLLVLEPHYPYVLRQPQDNYYGLHFFSRLPVEKIEVRRLVSDDVPSVKARLSIGTGRSVEFYGLHPRPPVPGQDSAERDAEIVLVAKEVREAGLPAIVAGDLNDVAWSHTTRLFQRISGLLDPRRGRGMFSSFHADYPVFRWPLDHVFHDASFRLIQLRRLPSIGSDHFPILIDLAQEDFASDAAEAPTPASGDFEEAAEIVETGREAADSAASEVRKQSS